LEEKYPQESETPSAQPQPALTKSPNLLQNKLRENGIAIGKYLLSALRWIVLALAVGTISGLIGGAFEKLLGLVGGIYKTAPYLIYLLPSFQSNFHEEYCSYSYAEIVSFLFWRIKSIHHIV